MKASPIFTPVRSRTANSFLASETVRLSGFSQNMLAGLGGFDGPLDVKMVGQRVVDGFDLRVGQQLFVGAISLRDAERARGFLGLAAVA
jgi:hypothetical protein